MTRLFVPELGTEFLLEEDWNFEIYRESRNMDFLEAFGFDETNSTFSDTKFSHNELLTESELKRILEFGYKVDNPEALKNYVYNDYIRVYDCPMKCWKATIPKGEKLKIERIYIRKGNKEYSSITFRLMKSEKFPKSLRFWTTLDDANEANMILIK